MAEKIVLPNGMRLLVEYMPNLRSVSTGLWIDTGSAREVSGELGVSHLLEHMLFKGTAARSALQISSAMDDVGGILNAFTSKELTCFYARCLDEHFDLSLELLSDMYHNSLFDPEATEKEKSVVIEEINMYQDEPDELVHELFARTIWPDHPYGNSISGSADDVAQLNAAAVRQYWQHYYNAASTVLSVAGNIRPEYVREAAERLFSPDRGSELPPLPAPQYACGDAFFEKDTEQSHICMGFPSVSLTDPDYYTATIVNSAFGGSSSSRLFQQIREERGLSYSPYSGLECMSRGGFFMAYASTQPERADVLARVMAGEFIRLREQGLTADELKRTKEQIKGSILLSLESSSNVMSRLGKNELNRHCIQTPEETVARLMAVSEDDVRRYIANTLRPGAMVLTQVGPQQIKHTAGGLF